MLAIIICIIKYTSSRFSLIYGDNLRIVLLSWLLSSALLFIYLKIFEHSDIYFWLLGGIWMMGFFVFFAFLTLAYLVEIRDSFKWPDKTDLVIKIILTLLAYIPAYHLLKDMNDLYPFIFFSLTSTIGVIVYKYYQNHQKNSEL
jgi:hypothetical protein